MTGPEHYREAERLLAEATDLVTGGHAARMERALRDEPGHPEPIMTLAQIHATLALAAASVRVGFNGTVTPRASEWIVATGEVAGPS